MEMFDRTQLYLGAALVGVLSLVIVLVRTVVH
jgi:hypothetical protein